MPPDYQDALAWLFSATDYEKMQRVRYNADTFSLERMRRLLGLLGSPEARLGSVHVAGTKGKGSTAAMVHAIARRAGLKAGLYTSPHLVDIRERIRVGDVLVSEGALSALIEAARPHVEHLRASGDPPTFFEIFTALAFRHFADEAVDLAVVEVGLGGRLDATNVLTPDVSIITAVSLDHTFQLGETLAAIAREKAGIVKPGVPVVSQPQPPEAMEAIEAACRAAGAPLERVGREIAFTWEPAVEAGRRGGRVAIRTPRAEYADLFLPLMGEHQAVNAATAVAAAERAGPLMTPSPLKGERRAITPSPLVGDGTSEGEARPLGAEVVREALAGLHWPGRMELMGGEPEVILDGAHNRASVEVLLAAVAQHFPGRRAHVVFAAAADKDIEGMLAVLASSEAVAGAVFTRTPNPRAADPADLAARYDTLGGAGGEAAGDVPSALACAKDRAGPAGLVLVCGSLYLVGEVREQSS
jgi:dihydrofolate synthase/folylpolyglutamate synthase